MNIYLYGCGGHAKVILDILHQQGKKVTALVDDNPPPKVSLIHGVPVYLATEILNSVSTENSQWIVAIGNNKVRQQIALKLSKKGYTFATAIHPSARIGLGVKIAPGTVVMANSVVNPDTHIGSHAIVNTGAIIDHDCRIGSYSHISPGCTLCGLVSIGMGVFLGTASSVSPLMEIGDGASCAAGSVVTKSLPADCFAQGSPAQIVEDSCCR